MRNRTRQRQIVHDRAQIRENDEIDAELFDAAYDTMKDTLLERDSYFRLYAPDGSWPDSTREVAGAVIAGDDRGYAFLRREQNEDYVDYAMVSLEYDTDDEWLVPGRTRLLGFEHDEIDDVSGWSSSRAQLYYHLLQAAGDRDPDELVTRVEPSFAPEQELPEQWETGDDRY